MNENSDKLVERVQNIHNFMYIFFHQEEEEVSDFVRHVSEEELEETLDKAEKCFFTIDNISV